jgi:hypothetical protein
MAARRGRSPDAADPASPAKDIHLVDALLQSQNADGGWPYRAGSSWTEPTVLALLALAPRDPAAVRGYAWLRGRQRPDGGWSPQPAVDQATWVTSLVALLPPATVGADRYARGVSWILEQTGLESTFWYRFRQRLLGAGSGEQNSGWPWFPGTAAWVTPTSLAILALNKMQKWRPSAEIPRRIESGRRYLLSRVCADGGWNHGSSHALGYDGASYPETTGVALMALRGVSNLDRNLAAAERHWRICRSAEGAAWLKLGMLSHGRKTEGWPARITPRNVRDTALCVLAERAEQGQDVFFA